MLEGKHLGADREEGFEYSFWWFCEEATFLAYEYIAREGASRMELDELRMQARKEELEGLELKRAELEGVAAWKTAVMRWNVPAVEEDGWKAKKPLSSGAGEWRSKAVGEERRKLKLKIRFRDTEKGKAGIWRVE